MKTTTEDQWKRLGVYLRGCRLESRMHQVEVGRRLRLNTSVVSRAESARLPHPSQDTIERIAEIVGADIDTMSMMVGFVPSDVSAWITASASNLRAVRGLMQGRAQEAS